MRPIYPGASIAGPAVTILAQPGDNWMLHVAIEQCQKGDVVVVGCTADNTDGMFGELLATSMRARGIKGLIIDAGCRDVKPLHDDGLPGLVEGDLGQGHGEGDAGRGQRSGGLRRRQCRAGRRGGRRRRRRGRVPRKLAVEKPPPRRRSGWTTRTASGKQLASGMLGLDMYKMREPLEKAGLRYVDNPEDV